MTSNEGEDTLLLSPDEGRGLRGKPLRSLRRDSDREVSVTVTPETPRRGEGTAEPRDTSRVDRLEEALLDAVAMIDELRATLEEEKDRNRNLRTEMSTEILRLQRELDRVAGQQKTPKLQAEFGGDPKQLRTFLWATRGFLTDKGHLFPSEEAKVRAIVLQLRDAAGEWAMSLIDAGDPAAGRADSLLSALERRFQDSTLSRRAWDDLKNIKQGNRSAAEYVDAFRKAANYASDLPERMLVEVFVDGLNLDLTTWCSHERPPPDLNGWYQLAMDGGIILDRLKKKSSAVIQKKTPAVKPPKVGPRLDNEERARRFREGLCLRCGGSGHRAADCVSKVATKPSPSGTSPPKAKSEKPFPRGKTAAAASERSGPDLEGESERRSEEESGNDSSPE